GWVSDINVGAPQSFGNHIKCSAAFKAFNVDNRGGGCLGILPLNDAGKKTRGVPLLHAHAEFVTDFDFCSYDDGLLATCSHDAYVKIWRVPPTLLADATQTNAPVDPLVILKPSSNVCRLETISWNPVVDCVLASSANSRIVLWDVARATEMASFKEHEELVQSVSWKADGSRLVSAGRDKTIRIWDHRKPDSCMMTEGHANNRDSRVVWLGNSDHVLSSGLGPNRERQVALRDIRNLSSPLKEYNGDSSLGIYLPLYDTDTNMLFLVAKGDITVNFWEVDSTKEPFLYECSKYLADVQTKGACLVPKRALSVMEGEVNRIQILTKDCIVPISYHVPRKTYRDFHADIFPDTRAPVPAILAREWSDGKNSAKVPLLSLDPSKRTKDLTRFEHELGSGVATQWLTAEVGFTELDGNRGSLIKKEVNEPLKERNSFTRQQTVASEKPTLAPRPAPRTKLVPTKSVDGSSNNKLNNNKDSQNGNRHNQSSGLDNKVKRQPSKGSGFKVRVSKYRHLNGNLGTREAQVSNLPALCKTIPGESEGFRANSTRVAIPLATSGGHLAILEMVKRGRLNAGVLPSLICGTNIMDFTWDPFDDSRIAIACDDGRIRVWSVPENGLTESLTQPDFELKGHKDKVTLLKFHPSAKDILASASQDQTILIWDLDQQAFVYELEGHTDQIFSMAWHPDGSLLATVCKDQKLRVYDPRKSSDPLMSGMGPSGTRGARVCWALGGTHLITTGFTKVSERQITLYDAAELTAIHTEGIDVSPAILIPFYDEDSSTLFLTGKGDTTIFCFEVLAEAPNFFPLSHFKCPGPHQSVSFLHKNACNVAQVEFATCFRLTSSTVEPLAFKVPRLRSEFFQDDLFPDTRMTWKPTMTSKQFTDLCSKTPARVSLRPVQMSQLSEAPEVVRPPPKFAPVGDNRGPNYFEENDSSNKLRQEL
ncbi:coronin-7-like, partial [Tropilaelaps mercedesae]